MRNKDTLKETLRYLGQGTSADPDISRLAESCLDEIKRISCPKSVYREFPILHIENNVIDIGAARFESKNLAKNLCGCDSLFLFAATLGIDADTQIRSYQRRGQMSRAVILDAAATAYIEEYCDHICDEIRMQHPSMHLRPRFSPGYGDLVLQHHNDILMLTESRKKIGLTLTDSLMLLPQKSVTAIIGLSSEECASETGCKGCSKVDCIYRRK